MDYFVVVWVFGLFNGLVVLIVLLMVVFGMGEEIVLLGCFLVLNNVFVVYILLRGWILICGNWFLYFICDVVVLYMRIMEDFFSFFKVISVEDRIIEGDFWWD